jgi:hypothetical protein
MAKQQRIEIISRKQNQHQPGSRRWVASAIKITSYFTPQGRKAVVEVPNVEP